MPMEPEALAKGTEVWCFQVEAWGEIFKPHIGHGVVTGGGEIQVVIQWEHSVERSNRYQRAGQLYASKREALVAAVKELEQIGADSYERARIANSAAAAAGLMLHQLDNPPVESEE